MTLPHWQCHVMAMLSREILSPSCTFTLLRNFNHPFLPCISTIPFARSYGRMVARISLWQSYNNLDGQNNNFLFKKNNRVKIMSFHSWLRRKYVLPSQLTVEFIWLLTGWEKKCAAGNKFFICLPNIRARLSIRGTGGAANCRWILFEIAGSWKSLEVKWMARF